MNPVKAALEVALAAARIDLAEARTVRADLVEENQSILLALSDAESSVSSAEKSVAEYVQAITTLFPEEPLPGEDPEES